VKYRSFYRSWSELSRQKVARSGRARVQTAHADSLRHARFCLAGKGSAVRIRHAPPWLLNSNVALEAYEC
jgi:hypothetical protein